MIKSCRAKKRASIDIGSNTTLLLVGMVENEGNQYCELANESRVTGLGRQLDKNKKFLDIAMDETFQALKEFRDIINHHHINLADVIVTATEASRVSTNAKSFFKKIKEDLGFTVTIITEKAEAYYTSYGVIKGDLSRRDRDCDRDYDKDKFVIMDIGGASTELIKVRASPFECLKSISLPVGSVRASDWIREGLFEENIGRLIEDFCPMDFRTKSLLCVAGTMTSLATMIKNLPDFSAKSIQGEIIRFEEFENFVEEKIRGISPDNFLLNYPFLGKRIYSIEAGALLAKNIAHFLGVEALKISTLGLRYGTLLRGDLDEQWKF